jgi:carbon-monoxide dehydrogenase small subunit
LQRFHGLQCGFCTPGVVLASLDLLSRVASPTEDEVRTALSGNLCRCTGYSGLVAAVVATGNQASVTRGSDSDTSDESGGDLR